jgi:hypothetical protein
MSEHGVRIFKNAITKDTAEKLIKLIKDEKETNTYSLTESPLVNYPVDDELKKIATDIMKQYRGDLKVEVPFLFGPEGVYLLEYPPFSHAPEHLDMTGHKEGRPNVLTIILQLNDDYDGGVFMLPAQGLTVKEKYSATVFPASSFIHPHAVSMITGDRSRFVVVYKVYGMESNEDSERPDLEFIL